MFFFHCIRYSLEALSRPFGRSGSVKEVPVTSAGTSSQPVQMKGGNPMFAPKSILVPTDFSEYSDRALKEAVDIAVQNNSKIYLLHVVDKLQPCAVDYCIKEEVLIAVEKESIRAAQEKMQKEVDRIAKEKKLDIVYDIKTGVPWEEILKEQSERKNDLIVIASHGRTGLLHHLGSVADKVMRSAKCPVLLVR
jgi:nucleotide-binding universal stress UspA family protein